jgi:hypothetical protein
MVEYCRHTIILSLIIFINSSVFSFADSTAAFKYGSNQYLIHLEKINYSDNKLELTTIDSAGKKATNAIRVSFPVYHFEIADIDNNGMKDILLGVVKRTHFDPVIRKRLFAYRIDQGYIRPLWLSSKVGKLLEDFKTINENNRVIIRTIEKDDQKNYYVGEYRWDEFGLSWIRYLGERISYDKAFKLFN